MPQAVPPGWIEKDNALTRTFHRADFPEALALVVALARLAEAADHHPDIDLRYRAVHARLSTHDAGHKVTTKDFALAAKINELSDEDIRHNRADLRRHFQI